MKLFRILSCLLITLLALFIFTTSAKASLLTVDKKGNIVWRVLSSEESIELEIPRRGSLEVKDIAEDTPDPEAKISLAKIDGSVKLIVSDKTGDKSLDITNYQEEIIEIEERPEVERVAIGVFDDKFTIKQKGVVAETDLAISIDPKTAALTLQTPSGFKYLSILPHQAVETVLRSNIINRIGQQDEMVLSDEDGELSYKVIGSKVFNVFNIFEYSTEVELKVSASTGEITSIEKPSWMKILGLLIV